MLLCAQHVLPVSSAPIENGAVLVKGDVIADIGQADMMRLRYPDEEVRDFGMAAICPGMIDLYARLEDATMRGLMHDVPYATWMKEISDLRRRLTPEECYESAYLGALESLASGVTTVGDISTTGASARAAGKLGLRAVIYREISAIDKNLVNYALKKGVGDLEKWSKEVDSDRVSFGLAPAPVFQCHPLVYKTVTRYASEHKLPVAMALAGSREEYRFVKHGRAIESDRRFELKGFMELPPWLPTGVTPVNYVLNWDGFEADNVMIIYGVYVNQEDINKLRECNVAVAVTPSLNAQLGMGVAPVDEYLRAGLRVGLATGAPGSLDFVDIFTEMRVELLIQRALNNRDFISAQTLLEMGTLSSAKALGLDSKIGSLEVGKQADIIAVDLAGSHQTSTNDPIFTLLSSGSNNDVMMTMVDGDILFERGQWHVDGTDVAKNIARVLSIRGSLRTS
jgi:5-methylthioadenosine/S-adenosylhomocysteine deaminase